MMYPVPSFFSPSLPPLSEFLFLKCFCSAFDAPPVQLNPFGGRTCAGKEGRGERIDRWVDGWVKKQNKWWLLRPRRTSVGVTQKRNIKSTKECLKRDDFSHSALSRAPSTSAFLFLKVRGSGLRRRSCFCYLPTNSLPLYLSPIVSPHHGHHNAYPVGK